MIQFHSEWKQTNESKLEEITKSLFLHYNINELTKESNAKNSNNNDNNNNKTPQSMTGIICILIIAFHFHTQESHFWMYCQKIATMKYFHAPMLELINQTTFKCKL